MSFFDQVKARIRGTKTVRDLERLGFQHGKNFHMQEDVLIDRGHCMLIKVGDDVTLAPRVHLLAHDASTKIWLDCTKLGEVTIGNRVFIGAGTIVMPGVSIGDDVIVGAGSLVTKSLQSGYVYAGSPARKMMSLSDYIGKQEKRCQTLPYFDFSYRIDVASPGAIARLRRAVHESGGGFIE